jgi:hypothetical protein
MAFFGLFGKTQKVPSDAAAWAEVAAKTSATLWHLIKSDPKMLASPYARVVLHSDWNVGVAADHRDPRQLLGPNDVSFVLLQEDRAALSHWIKELQSNPNSIFQQIATEEYAKKLVRVLMSNVEITD